MPRMEGNTLHAIVAPGKKELPKPKPVAPPQAAHVAQAPATQAPVTQS
jgi:hypothetical protein